MYRVIITIIRAKPSKLFWKTGEHCQNTILKQNQYEQ